MGPLVPSPLVRKNATRFMRTFTISEAAEITGLSRKAIARRVERGSLRSVVRNGRRRVPRSELVRAGLLEEGDEGTPDLDPRSPLLPLPLSGELELAGRSEDVLAALVRELLDRLERQSAEVAQLRALTVEAESQRLTNELTDLRVRIAELEGERPQTAHSPQAAEVHSRISELSRRVEDLARREIWLPPQAAAREHTRTAVAAPPPGATQEPPPAQPSAAQTLAPTRRRGPGARIARFLLEAIFIVVVAVAAWQADLEPLAIGAAMAVAWLVVAIVEFFAARREP
jgi:excisionase family DNA binding protein